MQTTILQAKLHLPIQPAKDIVSRSRLNLRLDESNQRKLTLVCAPAGFGKTTLLSDWISQKDSSITWISLDDADNDPFNLLTYFIVAIQKLQVGFGTNILTRLRSPQSLPLETLLLSLCNELMTITQPITVVFDDYHCIQQQAVHTIIKRLISTPSQIHFIMTSRTEPPLPLSRLRIENQLVELRSSELRFTNEETTVFFTKVNNLSLTNSTINILENRTEGWVAGLQVAALAIHKRDTAQINHFIKAFSGANRNIFDYLTDEVMIQRPKGTQAFLLKTSILKRLSASLCDAITGQDNSQTILEELERSNMFLIPLDEQRQWYRYHELFADFLYKRLENESTQAEIQKLFQQASEWHQANGSINEAITYAISGQDWPRATKLIEQTSYPMWLQAQFSTLRQWLEALPEPILQLSLPLSILYAFSLALTGQFSKIEKPLRRVETALQKEDTNHLLGEVYRIRALAAYLQENGNELFAYAQLSLKYLAADDMVKRSSANDYLGLSYLEKGQPEKALPYIQRALSISQTAGQKRLSLMFRSHLAKVAFHRGEFNRAVQIATSVLQELDDTPYLHIKIGVYAGLSQVYYEWNNLSQAIDYLQEGLELIHSSGKNRWGIAIYQNLAQIYWVTGHNTQAWQMLNEATHVASSFANDGPINRVKAHQARFHLAEGNIAAARQWVNAVDINLTDDPIYRRQFEYMTLARFYLLQDNALPHQLHTLLSLLNKLISLAEKAKRTPDIVDTTIFRALVFNALGKHNQTISTLKSTLSLAEQENYIRSFVDIGVTMANLLRQVALDGNALAFIAKLLEAFTEEAQPYLTPTYIDLFHSPLIEPLSPREIEVLHLIAVGLTNKQIATELHLAQTTIKKHITNINKKLNTKNRTHAVAYARKIGLLH